MASITCDFIDRVPWGQPASDSFLPGSDVDIWRYPVTENLSGIPYFMTMISGEELDKARSYRQEADVNRFIITRALLRLLLGKYLDQPPAFIQLETSAQGKPFLQSAALGNWHYNISHSGDWILIAVAHSEIGIDVEKTEPHFGYEALLGRCFSPPETRHIQMTSQARRSFYLLWTRKEALLKATGQGLVDHLDRIPCLDGSHIADPGVIGSEGDWRVSSFVMDHQYLCSIAYSPLFGVLRYWNANSSIFAR